MYQSNKNIAHTISQILLGESLTIAVAENTTCGYLQQSLTQVPYAESFFNGGITVCNLGEQTRLKSVPSIGTALEMARQIAGLFSSNIGVAITGYHPSSTKGLNEHFIYCAIVIDGSEVAHKKIRISKKKHAPKAYCEQALKFILRTLYHYR